jgi:hypothetical protein
MVTVIAVSTKALCLKSSHTEDVLFRTPTEGIGGRRGVSRNGAVT